MTEVSGQAPLDQRAVLQRALVEIRALKARLAGAEAKLTSAEGSKASVPIAVIGIGCRFAGGIDGPEALWRLLMRGEDVIGPRPPGRWDGEDTPGGFLDDVEGFDAGFFGIAPREAGAADPQHRLFLEVAWEALEHAAIDPRGLAGTDTGVFLGLATNDYAARVSPSGHDRLYGSGSSPAIAAGRLAYLLDLRGPAVTLDTACSSSLVAVHTAMQALRSGQCDTALAGGVSLMLRPALWRSFTAAGMLAEDGRSKSFDARADGYGRGEGCGVVVLRRLGDALKAGDPVLAVLRGAAIGQDGRSAGLTAPNGPAQAAVIRRALRDADLSTDAIDVIEAHGTGTRLGDPIEAHALAEVFAGRARPLLLGSVKGSLGHTEAAAGVAALIKAVLMLMHDTVPPQPRFTSLNPAIGRAGLTFDVPTAPQAGVRCVGVSSFGFSGTNAHVVVEAGPAREAVPARGPGLLLLSAGDPESLRVLAARHQRAFEDGLDWLTACHTAATGRARLPWWICVRSVEELAGATPSDGPPPDPGMTTGPRVVLPRMVFRRQRFPLPDPARVMAGGLPWEQVLEPGDPLLAGCGGMAHLGILLALLQQAGLPAELGGTSFLAPLRVAAARRVRVRRDDGRTVLESTDQDEEAWIEHLAVHAAAEDVALSPPLQAALALRPARDLYDVIEARGFGFGPEAKWLDRFGSDGLAAEAVLEDRGAVGLAPGVVEAAAQLSYAVLPHDAPAVMLASARRISCGPGGVPRRVWLRREPGQPDSGFVASFGVCDGDGHALLQVEDALFAPLPDHAMRWSRAVEWQAGSPPVVSGAAVILDGVPTDPAITEALASLAAQPDAALMWLVPRGDAGVLCGFLLTLIGRLADVRAKLRIVTQGAQATGAEAHAVDTDQASLWGLALALIAEQPARGCRLIDLDPALPALDQSAAMAVEAAAADVAAVAWRGGYRLTRALIPLQGGPTRPQRAAIVVPGHVSWSDIGTMDVASGMVVIEPVAAGLTFRDRLLLSDLAPAGSLPGSDCAGLVVAVGDGVTAFQPGQRVVAVTDGAIADRLMVEAWRVAPAPMADLADAATMPIPYLTALAGLGAIGPDDVVLVHQAGSATGLAALNVARRAGARVIATAGRGRHPWFAAAGIGPVLDSRDPSLWGRVVADVTVAFGAFDAATAARLSHARVVNLSRRAPGHFNLEHLTPAALQGLLGRLRDFAPLPRHIVARDALEAALERPAPTQVGRSVVLLRSPPPVEIEPNSLYLVTGAAGSLGRLVAGWLMAAGARVCLLDRVPVEAPAPHMAVTADVADAAAMASLFDRLMARAEPLRGLFHCAALTDDDPLPQLTEQRIAAVLHAKAGGARVLDRLTRERCQGERRLDHFVLFSSVVSLLPSARQGAYAAANAVLDQVARARRQSGHPALSLNFGPWDAGIGQRMGARAAAAWSRHGVTPILPAMGLRALPRLLAAAEPQRLVAEMAWRDTASAPEAAATLERVDIARLQTCLAGILGTSRPADLDPDTVVTSFGLDSLGSVEFSRALARLLGRPVAVDFTYNHPTFRAMEAALDKREPATSRTAGFTLLAPVWAAALPARAPSRARGQWTVLGEGAVAAALRASPGGDGDRLLDVSALTLGRMTDLRGLRAGRDAYFPALLAALSARPPRAVTIAMPSGSPLAGAIEGFAVALAAEQPDLAVRTLRLDPGLPDPAESILRDLAEGGGDTRLRLSPTHRQARRLEPLGGTKAPWRPDPEGSYLITGGSGGIGALVAAHLVDRGARHVVLASRRPSLPLALSDKAGMVRLSATDITDEDDVAALLNSIRRKGPPLAGVFHAAGVTANGRVGDAGWATIGRAFPAKADGAFLLHSLTREDPVRRFVLFSSSTAWFGLAGTAGYAAANGYLDDLAVARQAAGLPGQSIAWGAWEGVGMAADPASWADGRVPSLRPDMALAALDQALAHDDANVVVVGEDWRNTLSARRPSLAVLAGE